MQVRGTKREKGFSISCSTTSFCALHLFGQIRYLHSAVQSIYSTYSILQQYVGIWKSSSIYCDIKADEQNGSLRKMWFFIIHGHIIFFLKKQTMFLNKKADWGGWRELTDKHCISHNCPGVSRIVCHSIHVLSSVIATHKFTEVHTRINSLVDIRDQ